MVLNFNYTFTHDQHDDTALTLLLDLSDNFLKQFQNNTVVVQHEEIDRVELFEPTTLAALCKGSSISYLKKQHQEGNNKRAL
jgi:hypothetical protein